MKKAFKILAICPFFLPKLHPEVIVNAKLFLGLMERGHEVDILTVRDRGAGGYVYSTAKEAWWVPLIPHIHYVEPPERSRWGRFFRDAVAFLTTGYHYRGAGDWRDEFRAAEELLKKKRYDCIMFRAPGSMGLTAMRAARRHGLPLIINLSDPWYNFPAPYLKEKNLKFKQFMASRILKHASAATFPSQELADYSLGEYPVLAGKPCRIVPHAYRAVNTPPVAPKTLGEFTLTHAGSWGWFRNPLRLFKALKTVAERNPDLKFRFNVIGKANPDFESMVGECGVDGIVDYLGSHPYEETLALLKASDALVLLEADCEVGIFMPSKFVDYLQAGRPILAISPARGCISEYMKKFRIGEFADVRSVEEITEALQRMVDGVRRNGAADYDLAAAVAFFAEEPVRRTEELIAQLVGDAEAKGKNK